MRIGIIFVIVSIIVPLFLKYIGESIGDNSSDVFRYPRLVLYAGILGILSTFLSITMIFVKEQFEYKFVPLLLFVVLIHVGSWYLVILQANWKFEFLDNHFIVQNIFGKKRAYSYSKITKVKMYFHSESDVAQKIKIVIDGNSIVVEKNIENYSCFRKQLVRKLKKLKKDGVDITVETVHRKI